MSTRIEDISQPSRTGVPVWPGDTEYCEARTGHLAGDCPVNVSKFTLSTYAEAHVDAPKYYDATGGSIGATSLGACLRPCRVIDLTEQSGGESQEQLLPHISQAMNPHHAVRRHGMAVLEGLVPDDMPAGDYELIALLLKRAILNASVPAILRETS